MKKRPLSITITGWLFVIIGCLGVAGSLLSLVYLDSAGELADSIHNPGEFFAFALSVRILAVLGGAFLLYGFHWARWLLLVWMGYHVILSLMHPPMELLVHSVLFAVLLYVLFRPKVSAYFRGTAPPPQILK